MNFRTHYELTIIKVSLEALKISTFPNGCISLFNFKVKNLIYLFRNQLELFKFNKNLSIFKVYLLDLFFI
jgi:hypothetical protein